jgi:TPP-dependent pyruvate/acetoin dehydrogenase alpha subunit
MSLSVTNSMRSYPLPAPLGGNANAVGQAQPKSAEDEFLEIAKKSPLERMRDKIMQDMNVSDEQLAQMTPEEQQAVGDEIKRRIMESLQASTDAGQVVDKEA